jgi:heme-degrading monooxygenase HmoA
MTLGFAVIYRWRLKPGHEAVFEEAWRRMTVAIREKRGGLGSRLHKADDGTWVAYAQWPTREAWEESRALESADAEASAIMQQAIEESLPPTLLRPVANLLEPLGIDGE